MAEKALAIAVIPGGWALATKIINRERKV